MRLTDQRLLTLFLQAIEEASNGTNGFVVWKRRAWEWILRELEGLSQQALAKEMLKHVRSGGEIDQTREALDEYRDYHEYHYDFRFRVGDAEIYLETVLDEKSTGPVVTVVSAKYK
ncbi:MAG: hypothetical protein ACK56W_18210 [Pirellula sp.]|jgi:hypothetical protein|nr:hypothetical protein [Pirellula sp.]